jgi:hypothetical protein
MAPFTAVAEEQLEVERRFTDTGALSSYYWIGLEKSGNMYYWQDGTPVNNGFTSNANPVGGTMSCIGCTCQAPCQHSSALPAPAPAYDHVYNGTSVPCTGYQYICFVMPGC